MNSERHESRAGCDWCCGDEADHERDCPCVLLSGETPEQQRDRYNAEFDVHSVARGEP